MSVGLAPCEIASVATTAMADETPPCRPTSHRLHRAHCRSRWTLLRLESGHAAVHGGRVALNLAFVVALPLIAGTLFRALSFGHSEPARRDSRPLVASL